jgi:hypothetical protein
VIVLGVSVCQHAGARPIQHVADFLFECFRRERLVQKRDPGLQNVVVNDGILGVTGHADHLEPWPLLDQLLYRVGAAHTGHHDIGQHEIERRARL